MDQTTSNPAVLYLVATPIGNLDDISKRALHTLAEVDLVACEDTRHTRKLLNHYGISTKLVSYYREKEQQRAASLVQELLQGRSVALVSDAGTPGLSDPGAVIVNVARENSIPVIAIPGPSALTAALTVSGLEHHEFFFGGFLPAKKGQRQKKLQRFITLDCPLIFYESPRRISDCLADCLQVLGDRQALLFRELTKVHEECIHGPLSEVRANLAGKERGEMVLILHPDIADSNRPDSLEELLDWYKNRGYSLKDAVRSIAADLDLPRNSVYQQALERWHHKA
jgi:16S rRNA (cytidine1402-2'-O)-methyltransferase